MQKKDIIAELKKFETYKKFSEKQLERKTKATLEEMLRVEKENQPEIEYEPSNVGLVNGKIKAVKIDVENGKVSDVVIDNTVDGYRKTINCERFDMISFDKNNDFVLDDNGLNTDKGFFMINGKTNMIRGSVLIVGIDNNTGASIDTTIKASSLRNQVIFF